MTFPDVYRPLAWYLVCLDDYRSLKKQPLCMVAKARYDMRVE